MKQLLLTTIAAVLLVGTAFADPIHDAASTGDLARVQAELDKGVDVNVKMNNGCTPLDIAVWYEAAEVADLLRTHGGKHGVINGAAAGGDIEAVKGFLGAGADVNVTDEWGWAPIHEAVTYGQVEVTKLLIAEGADVNAIGGDWMRRLCTKRLVSDTTKSSNC